MFLLNNKNKTMYLKGKNNKSKDAYLYSWKCTRSMEKYLGPLGNVIMLFM